MAMWERIKENPLFAMGAVLGTSLVLSAIIIAGGVLEAKKSGEQVISVTGAADKFITADRIEWDSRVRNRGNSMSETYSALKRDSDVVKDYLLKSGVKAEELSLDAVSTETLYSRDANGNSTNNVEGYIMTQGFTVESERVDEIATLAAEANALINQGLTFVSDSPQFYYTKLNDLKVEMLGKATQNAKERATSMAKSTGNSIGLMRSAQMGVFQITSKNSTDVSDYGINDTSSKDKKVTAVVNVSFAVR